MNSARAIENFAPAISAHAAYIRAGFSSPAQASFFLICADDSVGADYRPRVMTFSGNIRYQNSSCFK